MGHINPYSLRDSYLSYILMIMQNETKGNKEYKKVKITDPEEAKVIQNLMLSLDIKSVEELEQGSYPLYLDAEEYGLSAKKCSNKQLFLASVSGAWFKVLQDKFYINRGGVQTGWQKYLREYCEERFNGEVYVRTVSNYILIAKNWGFLVERGLTGETYNKALRAITMYNKKGGDRTEDVSEVGKHEIATEAAKIKSSGYARDHEILRRDIQIKEKEIKELKSKSEQDALKLRVFEERLKQAGISTELPQSRLSKKLNVCLNKETLEARLDAKIQEMLIPTHCVVRNIEAEDLTAERIEEIRQKDRDLSAIINHTSTKYLSDVEEVEAEEEEDATVKKGEAVKEVIPLDVLAAGMSIMTKKIRRNDRPRGFDFINSTSIKISGVEQDDDLDNPFLNIKSKT